MNGKTITRNDLRNAIYSQVGLSRRECSRLVDRILDLVAEALAKGETVKLASFGTFKVREKRERVGRNPRTGKEFPIRARRSLSFHGSRKIRNRIAGEAGDETGGETGNGDER